MARTNPLEFSKLIIDQVPFIYENYKKHKKVNYFIRKEEICKVGLIRGVEAFKEAAERMTLGDRLPPLVYKEDLCMQIPSEIEDCTNKLYLDNYLEDKAEYLNYEYFGFHFDLDVACALTSVVLQIVDDNLFHFQRRDNILNPLYKYIGVTNKKIKNSVCLYISFAG